MTRIVKFRLIRYEADNEQQMEKQLGNSLLPGKYDYLTTITVMEINPRMLSGDVLNRLGAVAYNSIK